LTVGLNNLSTEVSGTIADGGQNGGTGGSLIKVGTGTLTLSGPNTYSGGTSILAGTLVAASNKALGSGAAQLFGGTLMISAGVTVSNVVSFAHGGVLDNAGTLNSNVLDVPSTAETVINSGIINGNVQLGGSTDIVQLFTGSKITGNLGLGATSNSTLILDGTGQELLSQAVIGT
jgi:fibronectin-binding autotransporter adhesin